MTDLAALVAELRRLDAAATPGPWEAREDAFVNGYTGISAPDGSIVVDTIGECCTPSDDGDGDIFDPRGAADAALITALRNALPALLDAVEARPVRDRMLMAAGRYELAADANWRELQEPDDFEREIIARVDALVSQRPR